MRRMAMIAGALALAATVGLGAFGGVASAHAAAGSGRVHAGGTWTIEAGSGGCEVQTFAARHTWSGDAVGDAGTYHLDGRTITETWTAGNDMGLTFSGRWRQGSGAFVGTLGGNGTGTTGELVKGALPGC
jgi:hypothetical protein